MDFNKTLPLRYFINLGRREDRRVETEIALSELGITAVRFPAVDARFVKRLRGYDSAGRYALALTQRLALRQASLKKAKAVLILEDDVIFHPDLLNRLSQIELPEDWGIFYLGCAHRKRPRPAGDGLVRTPYALDTHAFAVRAPYYRKVMAALGRRDGEARLHAGASDWFLADLHREIPTYACYPNLAWQALTASDLAVGTYSNYTPTGEQRASAGELIGLQAEMWGASRWNGWWKDESPTPPVQEGIIQFPEEEVTIPSSRPPKLALLFLTREDVLHPEIWKEFKEEAGDDVAIFSHSKDRSAASKGFLNGTGIHEWHETAWGGVSLVRAMLSLLKAGLEEDSITHFAFVSESCIPIKPWAEIRRRLRIDPRSMMHFEDAQGMKSKHLERISAINGLPNRTMRIHSQWSLLNREAAECITEHDLTDRFSTMIAADEHYFGTLMALRGYPNWDRILRQDPTWVKWDEETSKPISHLQVDDQLAAELAVSSGFFARKFPAGSNVGRWKLHRR